jgi:hypothetical protein
VKDEKEQLMVKATVMRDATTANLGEHTPKECLVDDAT